MKDKKVTLGDIIKLVTNSKGEEIEMMGKFVEIFEYSHKLEQLKKTTMKLNKYTIGA